MIADSQETLVCGWLSAILLLGLGLNYTFGFWQADPMAGIAIAPFVFKEGWETWEESQQEED
ncbi:hypothetical protein [Pleurocapsa sp. PCC 7327]|uniref:hypothetical protein n=1 Tax=Pleurocapsa sp. PCC 7327 TaxID=118163 RepID=UPI00031CEA6B|nr:hypothetical protein [Pleurocapsa sp. PCC 7327]